MILWYALAYVYSNSDVSVAIQPPSSVNGCTKHSDCDVLAISYHIISQYSMLALVQFNIDRNMAGNSARKKN